MALDLFNISEGLGIELDAGQAANVLIGDGAPGAGADHIAAPIGSVYLRTNAETDGLQIYWKFSLAGSSSADWKQATDKAYVDAIAAGLSWREPVLVRDNTTYANIAAAEAAANVGDTVDGVGIAVDDRILLTDLTTGNENVYIVSGSTGAWTFTEDPANLATDGDAVLVQQGTYAEQQWVYDGAVWVQFGSGAGAAELGYLRSFVGKSGPGSEMPTYSSTDVVSQASNLETAIGALDNAMGDGEITNDGGNNALSDDMSWGAAGTLEVTDALNDINDAIGDRSYTGDNVVTDGQSIAASIDALDAALGESLVQNYTNVTTITDIDILPVATTDVAKWIVTVELVSDPTRRYSTEIHAMNNGATPTGVVDWNKFSTLKIGTNFNHDITVVATSSNMRLQLTASAAVNVSVKRLAANLI